MRDLQAQLRGLALRFGKLEQGWILVERRVGRAKARVGRAVDTLRFVVLDQLWRWAVGVKLDLIDGWHSLAARIIEKLLQVWDGKVGNANILDTTGGRKLLHLLPRLDEVPVWEVLFLVARVC